MKEKWTKRALERLASASSYIARNFYPDYATAFRDDVVMSVKETCKNPRIGIVAFPDMKRPQYRKILCKNRNWWVYYRIMKDCIEVLSVKHILQNVKSPRNL